VTATTEVAGVSVSPFAGTWVLQQITAPSQLSAPVLSAALSTPEIRGFSVRVPWTAVDGSTALLDSALATANAHHVALSVRFLAGVWTPRRIIDGGPNYTVGGQQVPTPFFPDGRANTVFEAAYRSEVSSLAAWCRAHGVTLLHLPWYGLQWAELNNGQEVRSQPGYSYAAWLTAHEHLVDIAAAYAGPDLTIEFPMSGGGPLVQADSDLTRYLAAKRLPGAAVQGNGVRAEPGWGPGATSDFTSNQTVEREQEAAVWSVPGLVHGEQMIGGGDFDWPSIFGDLRAHAATYVEIYASSFASNLAHHAQLLSSIAAFANGYAR
jgi:hypothetical protein